MEIHRTISNILERSMIFFKSHAFYNSKKWNEEFNFGVTDLKKNLPVMKTISKLFIRTSYIHQGSKYTATGGTSTACLTFRVSLS